MFSQHNVWSTKCLAYTLFCLDNVSLTQCLVDKMFSQHNVWLTKCLVNTMFGWYNVWWTQCLIITMFGHQNAWSTQFLSYTTMVPSCGQQLIGQQVFFMLSLSTKCLSAKLFSTKSEGTKGNLKISSFPLWECDWDSVDRKARLFCSFFTTEFNLGKAVAYPSGVHCSAAWHFVYRHFVYTSVCLWSLVCLMV